MSAHARPLGEHGADTPIVALIKGADGVPVCKLECHTGEYDNESEINFSGDYQCALFAVKGTTLKSGDLLVPDTKDELSTDWWIGAEYVQLNFKGIVSDTRNTARIEGSS